MSRFAYSFFTHNGEKKCAGDEVFERDGKCQQSKEFGWFLRALTPLNLAAIISVSVRSANRRLELYV
jgi:hypothetical protein